MANEALFRMESFTQDLLEVAAGAAGLYSIDTPCNVAILSNNTGGGYHCVVNPGDVIKDLSFLPLHWLALVSGASPIPHILSPNTRSIVVANNVATANNNVKERFPSLIVGADYRVTFTLSNESGANVNFRLGTTLGTVRTANGTYTQVAACAANKTFGFDIVLDTGLVDSVTISKVKVELMASPVGGEYDYLVPDGVEFDLTEGGKRFVRAVSVHALVGATVADKSIRGQLLIGRSSSWAR